MDRPRDHERILQMKSSQVDNGFLRRSNHRICAPF